MQHAIRLLFAEREANARLAEPRELLFRELHHRVSNNLPVIGALRSVQRRQIGVRRPPRFSLDKRESLGLKIAALPAGQLGDTFTLANCAGRGALARLELPATAY